VILFLDFDGVLHPDAVYLRHSGQIELRTEGELFMWSDRRLPKPAICPGALAGH